MTKSVCISCAGSRGGAHSSDELVDQLCLWMAAASTACIARALACLPSCWLDCSGWPKTTPIHRSRRDPIQQADHRRRMDRLLIKHPLRTWKSCSLRKTGGSSRSASLITRHRRCCLRTHGPPLRHSWRRHPRSSAGCVRCCLELLCRAA